MQIRFAQIGTSKVTPIIVKHRTKSAQAISLIQEPNNHGYHETQGRQSGDTEKDFAESLTRSPYVNCPPDNSGDCYDDGQGHVDQHKLRQQRSDRGVGVDKNVHTAHDSHEGKQRGRQESDDFPYLARPGRRRLLRGNSFLFFLRTSTA